MKKSGNNLYHNLFTANNTKSVLPGPLHCNNIDNA
jgi:hypothetical protein